MTREEKFRQMTESNVSKLVSKMAIPTIISMLITTFYNMADTYFVGHITTNATAAVGAVGVVMPVMAIIQAGRLFSDSGNQKKHFFQFP